MGKPVILVDDAKNKQGLRIQNVPVRGTTKDIPKLVSRYGIREIIVAIPSLGTGRRMQEILELCNQTDVYKRQRLIHSFSRISLGTEVNSIFCCLLSLH